jgi:hypothetical protein
MKQCFRCGELKPYEEFHKKTRSKDGYSSWCKSCYHEYDAKRWPDRYKTEAPIMRTRAKKFYGEHKKERLEYIYDWEKSNPDKVRVARKTYHKKHDLPNRKKIYAQNTARRAIKSGKIVVPDICTACKKNKNQVKRLELHHPDYDKPLEVYRVCSKCHHQITKGERSNEFPFVLLSQPPHPDAPG